MPDSNQEDKSVIVGESYRIKSLIGEGGMGNVFRAEHLIIHKEYALKMLAPDQITQDNWNRFQAEGKAIAKLNHPNIVKIYNMGVDQTGFPYYVMDLLDGVSLHELIHANKTPDYADLLLIFVQMASALSYAHSKGIIHRDIKPSNIMILNEDKTDTSSASLKAMLVDFGIAKLVALDKKEAQKLTQTGNIFGTPFYMSPEQCMASQLDGRSDIYSFGCTLFEALTGRPPLVGKSATETVMMHISQKAPTLQSVSGIAYGAEMEAFMAKLLQKDRDHRHQTMERVELDLKRLLQNKPVSSTARAVGFKETQIDVGQRDSALSRKLTTILVSIVAVLAIGAVCGLAVLNHKDTTQNEKMAKTAGDTLSKDQPNPLSEPGLDPNLTIKEPSEEEKKRVAEFLDSGRRISSDRAGGMRTMHFPHFVCGTLRWPPAFNTQQSAEEEILTSAAANGDAKIPDKKQVMLLLDRVKNNLIWTQPKVLKAFGDNELEGLKLTAPSVSGEIFLSEDLDKLTKMTDELLVNAQDWKKLYFVELYGIATAEKGIKAMGKMSGLTHFTMFAEGYDARNLAAKPFLRNLHFLKICGFTNIDDLLKSMRGNQNIEQIMLHKVSVDKGSIAALRDCKHLVFLEFKKVNVDREFLEELNKIPRLKVVHFFHCQGIGDELLPTLSRMRRDLEVGIRVDDKPSKNLRIWERTRPRSIIFEF